MLYDAIQYTSYDHGNAFFLQEQIHAITFYSYQSVKY